MTPWPAIPALPGHVVEVARRADGARRRLDLLVHPEGLRPHHVAIRLDLREGRAPELHAGFGAEARPVCLPEHLDPQGRAVEAAAGLVAQVAGEAAAERLRARWAAARARLEERVAEIAANGPSADALRLSQSGSVMVLAGRTRPGEDVPISALFGADGTPRLSAHPPKHGPLDGAAVAALPNVSGHARLELLRDPDGKRAILRSAFLQNPHRPVFAVPLASEGWLGWRERAPGVSVWNDVGGATTVVSPDGTQVDVRLQPNGAYGLNLHALARDEDGATVELRVGQRDPIRGISRPPRMRSRGRVGSVTLSAMFRTTIEAIAALDPDLSEVSTPFVTPAEECAFGADRVARGLTVPDALRPLMAAVLAGPHRMIRAGRPDMASGRARATGRRSA